MKKLLLFVLFASIAGAQESKKPLVFIADRPTESSQFIERRLALEQTRILSKNCTGVLITADPKTADYLIEWESKTWGDTQWGHNTNNFVVYTKDGVVFATGGTDKMVSTAKDICKAVMQQKS